VAAMRSVDDVERWCERRSWHGDEHGRSRWNRLRRRHQADPAGQTPDFPSYLYVTYLPANGDAVLIYKPRGVVPSALPPGTTVDLGGGDDPRVFRIGGPPFGAEMVVAVATASPLFTDAIPVFRDRARLSDRAS